MNLHSSGSFPPPFPLIGVDNHSVLPQSHCPTMSLLLISDFPRSYFCISLHLPLQLSLPGPSSPFPRLLPPKDTELCCSDCYLDSVHPCSPSVCVQSRVHYIVLPKLLLTPYSSFLVEFHLLVIGLMGLCEVLDWLLQLLPSFRVPSIHQHN